MYWYLSRPRYLLGLALLCASLSSVGETTTPPITHHQPFSIQLPAQPLVQALADSARQVNLAIVFNPQQLAGLQAPPVNGAFTPQQLLDTLLETSGFKALQQASGWLIVPQPAAPAPVLIAQEIPAIPALENLLVLGNYSRSLHTALQRKRASNQVVEHIVAADIAHFPAHNIAEAIQRSTGVSVVRDRGEALFLSIRGLPAQFNRVSLKGHNLSVNENVRNSEQYGRRFHYDTFPAELVAGVEVLKSPTANQDEGAIGGSVNIRTFAPLELAKNRLSLTANTHSAELVGEWLPQFSLLGNWVNSEQTLGLMLATTQAKRSSRQDRALNFRWEKTAANTTDIITPAGLRPTLELEERARQGFSSELQWRPNEQLQLSLSWLSLQQDIRYQEFSYSADYHSEDLLSDSIQQRGQALIAGATRRGSVQIGRESAGLEDTNKVANIDLQWQRDDWQLKGSWVNSQAQSRNPEAIKRTRLRRTDDVSFSFNYPTAGHLPDINYQNIELLNPEDFPGRRLEWRRTQSVDQERAVDLSVRRQLEHHWLDAIKFGVQKRTHQRDYWRKDRLITEGISGNYFSTSYFQPLPAHNFLQGSSLPTNWLVPNEDLFWQAVDESAFDHSPASAKDLQNSYVVSENSKAAFIKLELQQEQGRWPVRGDIGLRWINTRQKSQGYSATETDQVNRVSFEQNYHYLLPSTNLVAELNDQLLWRTALAKVLARADYQDLAPRLSVNSGDLATAIGGNPTLKPVTGWQLDSALEYYPDSNGSRSNGPLANGLISAGIFIKKLDNFFQTRTQTTQINGRAYELTSPDNGASAKIAGIELAWQQRLPEPLQHWGAEANYTHTYSRATYLTDLNDEDTQVDSLADVAKNSLNLGLYRETERWEVRAYYSWRDRVLNQVASANLAAQNIEPFGSLDLHCAWHLNAQLTISAEATNLTNSAQWETVMGGEFAGYTHYGRSYWLGINLHLD